MYTIAYEGVVVRSLCTIQTCIITMQPEFVHATILDAEQLHHAPDYAICVPKTRFSVAQ
jgi:hypothetical protein